MTGATRVLRVGLALVRAAFPRMDHPHTHVCTPPPQPQERIRIPEDKMDYYKDLAEM